MSGFAADVITCVSGCSATEIARQTIRSRQTPKMHDMTETSRAPSVPSTVWIPASIPRVATIQEAEAHSTVCFFVVGSGLVGPQAARQELKGCLSRGTSSRISQYRSAEELVLHRLERAQTVLELLGESFNSLCLDFFQRTWTLPAKRRTQSPARSPSCRQSQQKRDAVPV